MIEKRENIFYIASSIALLVFAKFPSHYVDK